MPKNSPWEDRKHGVACLIRCLSWIYREGRETQRTIIITFHRAHMRLSLYLHASTTNGVFFSTGQEEDPIRHACVCLLFFLHASTTNGELFYSCWEAFLFVVIARPSCYLCVWARKKGSSSIPLDKNSHLLCLLLRDRHRWSPNFSPVIKIKSCRCEIIWAAYQ